MNNSQIEFSLQPSFEPQDLEMILKSDRKDIYMHAYIPTYLPTYIHTYIHTYIQLYDKFWIKVFLEFIDKSVAL